MEGDAGISVKTLPGTKDVVVCGADQCARLSDFRTDGGEFLVNLDALNAALHLRAVMDFSRQTVSFERKVVDVEVADKIASVGKLAPDLLLSKLDGTPVALSDFRGKRVLINS